MDCYEGLREEANHRSTVCSQQGQTFAITSPGTYHASPQAGSPEESMGQSCALPASAIQYSSGLSVGEGISPLEGTGPTVVTLVLMEPRGLPWRGSWQMKALCAAL